MLRRAAAIASVCCLVSAATSRAEPPDPAAVFVSGRIGIAASPLLAPGERAGSAAGPTELDYAVFLRELIAYVTKEALPEAEDEYAGSSGTPWRSRLLDTRHRSSRFGAHCRIVLKQVRSELSPLAERSFAPFASPPAVLFGYAVRAASTLLALGQVLSEFREGRDEEGSGAGFSLNPRVGARRLGASITIRW
jgi:hypothetical protein